MSEKHLQLLPEGHPLAHVEQSLNAPEIEAGRVLELREEVRGYIREHKGDEGARFLLDAMAGMVEAIHQEEEGEREKRERRN